MLAVVDGWLVVVVVAVAVVVVVAAAAVVCRYFHCCCSHLQMSFKQFAAIIQIISKNASDVPNDQLIKTIPSQFNDSYMGHSIKS